MTAVLPLTEDEERALREEYGGPGRTSPQRLAGSRVLRLLATLDAERARHAAVRPRSPVDDLNAAAHDVSRSDARRIAAQRGEPAPVFDRPRACPCLHTTPCDPRCTCTDPLSSVGCLRCCSYGGPEQQKAKAERLAAHESSKPCDHAAAEDTYSSHGGFVRWCPGCGAVQTSEYADESKGLEDGQARWPWRSPSVAPPYPASVVEAVRALEIAWEWHRYDEEPTERFERIAGLFYRETGFMRPGKDDMGQRDESERRAAWEAWTEKRTKAATEAIRSALASLPKELRDAAAEKKGVSLPMKGLTAVETVTWP